MADFKLLSEGENLRKFLLILNNTPFHFTLPQQIRSGNFLVITKMTSMFGLSIVWYVVEVLAILLLYGSVDLTGQNISLGLLRHGSNVC